MGATIRSTEIAVSVLKKGRLHQITFLLCLILILISREQQEGISSGSDALENYNSLLSCGPRMYSLQCYNFLARKLEVCICGDSPHKGRRGSHKRWSPQDRGWSCHRKWSREEEAGSQQRQRHCGAGPPTRTCDGCRRV